MKIVILPGLDGTNELSSEFTRLLSSEHEPLLVKFPTNLAKYGDLQKWLDRQLPKDDYIIVAQSFSGPLAILIASSNPIGLKGVVFVSTFAKSPRWIPNFITYLIGFLPLKSKAGVFVAQPFLMGRSTNHNFTQAFRIALKSIPSKTIAGRLRAVRNVDVRHQLSQLAIPNLYISASKDRLVPPVASRDFNNALSDFVKLDGPHFLLQANPSGTAKVVNNFATALGLAAR